MVSGIGASKQRASGDRVDPDRVWAVCPVEFHRLLRLFAVVVRKRNRALSASMHLCMFFMHQLVQPCGAVVTVWRRRTVHPAVRFPARGLLRCRSLLAKQEAAPPAVEHWQERGPAMLPLRSATVQWQATWWAMFRGQA